MLYHISKLNKHDQEMIKKAPLLVSILIAGSDGEVEVDEIEKTVNLIHTKSFSESSDIRHLYREIDHDVEEHLKELLAGFPSDVKEREALVSDELAKLNRIMEKLDPQVALDFYNSLRKFAVHVAQTTGGVLGLMKIQYHEKELVHLPMITPPSNN